MTLARTHAISLVGVQGHPVEIEADIENGLVALLLVGLPDTALREARDRIRSAIVSSGESWPQRRITVGLSPASLPKRGSSFDLGIAAAILSAAGAVPAARLSGVVLLGELGLDGKVRPVPGVLPAAAAAAAAGFRMAAVPAENAPEACLVPQLRVAAVPSLGALVDWLRDEPGRPGTGGVQVFEPGKGPRPAADPPAAGQAGGQVRDLAEVVGQPTARRAAEICAAGGHHLLLLGPPGVGKAMLARTLGHITCDFVSRCRPITSRRRAFNAIVIDCPCRPGRRRSPRPAETDAGRPRPVCRGVISSPGRCRLPGRRTAVHRHRVYPGMRAQMRTAGGVARSSVRPGRCAVGHRDQPKGVHQTHESQSLRRVSTPVVP